MKRRLVACFTALVFLFPAIASAQISLMVVDIPKEAIVWDPVCRHHAIYWATMVGEDYPVRIKYGHFLRKSGIKNYHVQPQMYIGDQWWYFKVENDKDVVIISKPSLLIRHSDGTEEQAEWKPQFHWKTLTAYTKWFEESLIKELEQ